MGENKIDKSKNIVSNMNLSALIADNLKQLIKQNKTTQKALAEQLNISEAAMSAYCQGNTIPNGEFFVSLKNHYDISIDDFLTKSITPVASGLSANESLLVQDLMAAYQKYCGVYYVYYFDTKNYKGRD